MRTRGAALGFLALLAWCASALAVAGEVVGEVAATGAPASGPVIHSISIVPNEAFQRDFPGVLKTHGSAPEHLRALATLLEESKLITPRKNWQADFDMHQAVVEQIFLYLVNNGYAVRRNDWGEVIAVQVAHHLNIQPASFAQALIPYLAHVDPGVRKIAMNLLHGGRLLEIEGGRFRHVDEYLRRIDIANNPEKVHPLLWHIMYRENSRVALYTAMELFLPPALGAGKSDREARQRDEERKRLLRYVAHIESTSSYTSSLMAVRLPGEVMPLQRPDPVAYELLGELSRSGHWFVRLYVASVMRQPGYFDEDRAARLAEDEDPAVRMMMEEVLHRREEQHEKGP